MNANSISIVGRLAGKPVLKGFNKANGEGGFRSFMRVAVTRLGDLGAKRDDQRTNFVPVVAWGGLAQRIAQYLDKGTEVYVEGELIAESKPKLDAAGNAIVIDGKTQYDEYIHVQARSCQFGRKSMKNQSPADIAAQLASLQTRIDSMTTGEGAPTETPASTPATPAAESAPAEGANPFEDGAATA
jgi:single-stranded DNA-binding protein